MQEIAKERNGECLSSTYIDVKTPLEWRCSEGHSWFARPMNIKGNNGKKGTWCPVCAANSKIDFKWFQEYAISKNGICLSSEQEYSNLNSLLKFDCKIHGEFHLKVSSLRAGSWCPRCGNERIRESLRKKDGLEVAEMIIKKMGGKCLSKEYIDSKTKLRVKCNVKEHPEWEINLANLQSGKWCPKCGHEKMAKKRRYPLSYYEEMFKEENYNLVSKKENYKNSSSKITLKCPVGEHPEFIITASRFQSGDRCPYCSRYMSEDVCRAYLETYLEVKLEKKRPEWLKTEDGRSLELDGYNEELKVAFEHDGRQHYEVDGQYTKTEEELFDLQMRDKQKEEICLKNGVLLFRIPQLGYYTKVEDLPDLLIEQSKKRIEIHNIIKKNISKEVSTLNHSGSLYYQKLKKIVFEKNGKILTQVYLGPQTPLEFKCEVGHTWFAKPMNIVGNRKKKGTWCPKCSPRRNQFNTSKSEFFEELKKIAKMKNGKLLSKKYISDKRKLKWGCNKKHTWEAVPASIKSGTWCPICSNEELSKKFRTGIEVFIEIAKKNEGECLSHECPNLHTKLKWRCKKGHEWEATARKIKGAKDRKPKWCPYCEDEDGE